MAQQIDSESRSEEVEEAVGSARDWPTESESDSMKGGRSDSVMDARS